MNALLAIREAGLHIPRCTAFVACDAVHWGMAMDPPHSVVDYRITFCALLNCSFSGLQISIGCQL